MLSQQAETLSKGAAAISKLTLNPPQFWDLTIPLPPLPEQQRIVARIEALAVKINEARAIRHQQNLEMRQMLLGAFQTVTRDTARLLMGDVAPLVRRSVDVDPDSVYPELGIRSFGNGTFHKPPLSGLEIGGKRIFKIEPNDLLFNNVFAWEGAIAVAKSEDAGRFGSHRFITCVPREDKATSRFLCFYFLTNEGLELIRAASPGGAGRNRTLGLEALANIPVPIPNIDAQLWFDGLQAQVDALKKLQRETTAELDALLPSVLDKAFKGEL
jgi:type I restriction enzyme S subunit